MTMDLASDFGLHEAIRLSLQQCRQDAVDLDWIARLKSLLARVNAADRDLFQSPAFQQELWNDETVSVTGPGHVDITGLVRHGQMAAQLWQLKQGPVPDDPQQASQWLAAAWEQMATIVRQHTSRQPKLKMYRVFAAIWPRYFTTIASESLLRDLIAAMQLPVGTQRPVEQHQQLLRRLDAVTTENISLEERMILPWKLLQLHQQAQASQSGPSHPQALALASADLIPQPAGKRRRGMLAIAGMWPSVLAMLEFARGGCTRSDMLEHIRSINPNLGPSALQTNLNALVAEWGALRIEGNAISLTPRGEALLESDEPEPAADWLLTRILGFDNLLYLLAHERLSLDQVIAALQQVNPAWTSNYSPRVLINWLKALDLIQIEGDKSLQLTERGNQWAARIHWVPGVLPPVPELPNELSEDSPNIGMDIRPQLPNMTSIMASFPVDAAFEQAWVARLHAGLWSHARRHFAVLAGLSGSGKTLLAMSYAKALRPEPAAATGWHVVTVQPGWHDPSSLLGYVHPIDTERYVRTGFLEFLLQAHANPEQPYTVLLDEMNLSHPEQYLAPLLSAMETGGNIELHAQGQQVDGVPGSLPYPHNLVLIGTVNMDETTHGLSDKILDRAHVMEFWDIDIPRFPGWQSTRLDPATVELLKSVLSELMQCLRPVRLHFGWRTLGDVIGYVEAATGDAQFSPLQALDHVIYAKILPKLRGESTAALQQTFNILERVLRQHQLSSSADKVSALRLDLTELGSARFWR